MLKGCKDNTGSRRGGDALVIAETIDKPSGGSEESVDRETEDDRCEVGDQGESRDRPD